MIGANFDSEGKNLIEKTKLSIIRQKFLQDINYLGSFSAWEISTKLHKLQINSTKQMVCSSGYTNEKLFGDKRFCKSRDVQ